MLSMVSAVPWPHLTPPHRADCGTETAVFWFAPSIMRALGSHGMLHLSLAALVLRLLLYGSLGLLTHPSPWLLLPIDALNVSCSPVCLLVRLCCCAP